MFENKPPCCLDPQCSRRLQALVAIKEWGWLLCVWWRQILVAFFLALSLTNAATESKHAHHRQMSNENISWTGFAGKAVIAEIHRQSKAQRTADEKLKLKGEKTRIKMELRYLARSCRANWFGEINLATYTL